MTRQVNLSDFDFTQPYIARSYKGKDAIADVTVTIGVKGKNRKTNNASFLLTHFFSKTGAAFKTLSIGTNKFSKRANVVVAFDIPPATGIPVANIGSSEKAKIYWASGKGMIHKLYNAFGIQIPDVPGTSTRFFLNLEPIEGMPKVYSVVPVMLERIDAYGSVSRADLKKLQEREKQEEVLSRINA